MRFLINSIKVFHYVCVALLLTAIYGSIFHHLGCILFVIVAYALCWQTRSEYKEMEQEIIDTIEDIQERIRSYCAEVEKLGIHVLEVPINNKFYTIEFCYYADVRETIGAEHMGDYEKRYEIANERISLIAMECRDDDDEIWDCGFTLKELQEGL